MRTFLQMPRVKFIHKNGNACCLEIILQYRQLVTLLPNHACHAKRTCLFHLLCFGNTQIMQISHLQIQQKVSGCIWFHIISTHQLLWGPRGVNFPGGLPPAFLSGGPCWPRERTAGTSKQLAGQVSFSHLLRRRLHNAGHYWTGLQERYVTGDESR